MAEELKLKEERWGVGKKAVEAVKDFALAQGKRAVVSTKGGTFRRLTCSQTGCPWYVCLARLRSKEEAGDWHVTSVNLEHINCTGSARPTRKQLESNDVVRATLAADPSSSAARLVTQLKHQDGVSASQHVMYRAKEKISTAMFSEDPTSIELLPSFLDEFQRLNPGTFTELHRDEKKRFCRAIVIFSPKSFEKGQRLYGVDAAHMKHRKYNGVQLILVSRDGNFSNRVAAFALAPVEDTDNYAWFFGRVLNHGFPLTTCPVFSDRHVGIVSAAKELQVMNVHCVRHMIGNMRSDKTVRLSVSQDRYVWQANAATTEADYLVALEHLKNVNIPAYEYLKVIPPAKWTLHPYYDTVPLYGWRTTNFVESEQAKSLRLKPRMLLPFEFFKTYTTIVMGECYGRLQLHKTWTESGRTVTPRADNKFQQQVKFAGQYTAVLSSDTVGFVIHVDHPIKQRRVDVEKPECSCTTWKQQKLPCRHIIAVLIAQGKPEAAIPLIGGCYTVEAYGEGMDTLTVPEDSALAADKTLKPAPFVRQVGRSRKRRIRSRGETGGKARKPYKCGRCGATDGHNKATCRQATA